MASIRIVCSHSLLNMLLPPFRHSSSRRTCSVGLSSTRSASSCDGIEKTNTWLVVGDGDLSYSASFFDAATTTSIADFDTSHHHLIATVLEDDLAHQQTYKNSTRNADKVTNNGHTVRFGIDATKLEDEFAPSSIDRIVFNFPHWRGKSNIRRNRELLDNFLCSASKVLKDEPSSEIHIALCPQQGGCDAPTLVEWKSSWMPQVYAAHYGLLLRRTVPFDPHFYERSSHRGVDRGFAVGESPLTYIFGWPTIGETVVDEKIQVAFRHELRLILNPERFKKDCPYAEDLVRNGNVVPDLVHSCAPKGIKSCVPLRSVIFPSNTTQLPFQVYFIVYSGESRPITRLLADAIREKVEATARATLKLDVAKPGVRVSRAFSNHLLPSIIERRKRTSNQTDVLVSIRKH